MDNPLNALAWLANHLGTRGSKVGDTIRAMFTHLGSVGINVVP